NLLREGLDIPEVALVAILDADKEGFLRSETSLIQTVGRAARNSESKVIMYADTITKSMEKTINETNRRRKIQMEYNEAHGIIPQTIIKEIRDVIEISTVAEDTVAYGDSPSPDILLDKKELAKHLTKLEKEMKAAAKDLQFERAAQLRDEIQRMKRDFEL
ncbi:MAG: UvrB/UvrC motif-containing protein, partial [Clostridium sp.]